MFESVVRVLFSTGDVLPARIPVQFRKPIKCTTWVVAGGLALCSEIVTPWRCMQLVHIYTQVIYMVRIDVAAAAGLWLPCLFMA